MLHHLCDEILLFGCELLAALDIVSGKMKDKKSIIIATDA